MCVSIVHASVRVNSRHLLEDEAIRSREDERNRRSLSRRHAEVRDASQTRRGGGMCGTG